MNDKFLPEDWNIQLSILTSIHSAIVELNNLEILPYLEDSSIMNKLEFVMNSFLDQRFDSFNFMLSTIPMHFGGFGLIVTSFFATKHSLWHWLQGLIPCGLILLYVNWAFSYSKFAWAYPAVAVFVVGFYSTLHVTRQIINNVTKIDHYIFDDFHLSLPFLI